MKFKFIVFAVLVSFLYGCATSQPFEVSVDSINSADSSQKIKYVLFCGNKDVDDSDLQYQEYASYVDRALELRGYQKVKSFQDAEIAIFLGYGVGDPQTHQFTYSVPTYGQTGVASSHTTGTVNSYGNMSNYSGTTTYTPTYGITGATTQAGEYVSYSRFVFLNAYDVEAYKQTNKLQQAWQTTITSTGSSNDLRRVLPVMIAAASTHIGSNTGKKLQIGLDETDKRVLAIKGVSAR